MTHSLPTAPDGTLSIPSASELGKASLAAVQRRALAIGATLAVVLIAYVGSTQSAAKATLAGLGVALGVALFHSRFGFTSAWRQLVSVGQGRALQAHMLMLGIAVLGFSIVIANGSALFGTTPGGYVAPITLGLFVGSFLFGLGMQLGGSCASGTLFATGSGHIGVIVTLTGFVAGSGLGVAGAGFWTGDGPGFVKFADPFSFTQKYGSFGGTVVVLILLGIVALLAEGIIRRRRPPRIEQPPTAQGWARLLRGSWPLWVGAIALAVLNIGVLLVTGRPWGVTSAFRLWASKIMDSAGLDVASWSYWTDRPGLTTSIFSDNTTVANFGIIVGALTASAAAGGFALVRRVPRRHIIAGLAGGALMGYGATFAAGCNIGAYFSGIASGSLHGWLWAVFALVGTWVGLKARPLFGLTVPKPSDSVC
ncbi:MAG: YeeE/YedE family protein [Actinomycetota bacterium]|nr:YeeE/YedE family protein [Actinomycetota bacterium]MDA2972131.1 YeeE/YedE family protein [Actinomycetota bacterium]MDA3001565.1 YeeE/YedE family protein [Actinomycetota bacterium]